MSDADLNRIFEILGKIGAQVEGTAEKVDDLRAQSNERHTENMRRIGALEESSREFQAASLLDRAQIKQKLDNARDRLGKIERPVQDFVALRNKVGAWISIVIAGGFAVWFFVGPFWGVIEQKVVYSLFPGLRPPQ